MVQLKADVADGVPGGLGACWVTLGLFQGDILTDQQGKRHGRQVSDSCSSWMVRRLNVWSVSGC